MVQSITGVLSLPYLAVLWAEKEPEIVPVPPLSFDKYPPLALPEGRLIFYITQKFTLYFPVQAVLHPPTRSGFVTEYPRNSSLEW